MEHKLCYYYWHCYYWHLRFLVTCSFPSPSSYHPFGPRPLFMRQELSFPLENLPSGFPTAGVHPLGHERTQVRRGQVDSSSVYQGPRRAQNPGRHINVANPDSCNSARTEAFTSCLAQGSREQPSEGRRQIALLMKLLVCPSPRQLPPEALGLTQSYHCTEGRAGATPGWCLHCRACKHGWGQGCHRPAAFMPGR